MSANYQFLKRIYRLTKSFESFETMRAWKLKPEEMEKAGTNQKKCRKNQWNTVRQKNNGCIHLSTYHTQSIRNLFVERYRMMEKCIGLWYTPAIWLPESLAGIDPLTCSGEKLPCFCWMLEMDFFLIDFGTNPGWLYVGQAKDWIDFALGISPWISSRFVIVYS